MRGLDAGDGAMHQRDENGVSGRRLVAFIRPLDGSRVGRWMAAGWGREP